jgi:hypothetical protein
MKITARITDVKRHTLGYVIDNKDYTRYETVKLARSGMVRGVKATRYGNIHHVIGTAKSLYGLPVKVSTPHRMRSRRSYSYVP